VASESGKESQRQTSLNQSEKKKAVMSGKRRTSERQFAHKPVARGQKSPALNFKYFPHENCAAISRSKQLKSALQRGFVWVRVPNPAKPLKNGL
jgi:hypothetical protein